MNKLVFVKRKRFIQIKNLPAFFERYEILVVIGGTIILFLLSGYIFYNSAYKIVSSPPKADIELPQINLFFFDKTLKELSDKKQPALNESIVDPFR